MGQPVGAFSRNVNLTSQNQLYKAFVDPAGRLSVTGEGGGLLSDQFNGSTLDTVNRWVAPVLAGGGTATISGGLLTLATGTTASNAAAVSSIETFSGIGASSLVPATIVQFEAGVNGLLPLGVNAFFGQATPNGSYTAATPLATGLGFERTLDGKFSAVYYNGNVRTLVADLTSKVLDGAPHLIFIRVRLDATYFFVDNVEEPIAVLNVPLLTTFELPVRMHAINHTAPPTVAPTVRFFGVTVIDTGYTYPLMFNGQTVLRARAPAIFKSFNLTSVATETTIWTPAAGRRFRLMGYVLTSGTVGGNVVFKDNTAGTTILVVPFGAASTPITSTPMGNGILSATAGNVLTATGAATQTLSGYVFGTEE